MHSTEQLRKRGGHGHLYSSNDSGNGDKKKMSSSVSSSSSSKGAQKKQSHHYKTDNDDDHDDGSAYSVSSSRSKGTSNSSIINKSNNSGSNKSTMKSLRRSKQKSDSTPPAITMEHIDEEGGNNTTGGDHYEMASLLRHDKMTTAISHGHDDHNHNSAGDNQNSKNNNDDSDDSDNTRSRELFFRTAFWISCWYGTSLATLFLNKIILSRPNSSVHVLGMCQMSTAAVLGGWSAYGGGEFVQKRIFRGLTITGLFTRITRGLGRGGHNSSSSSSVGSGKSRASNKSAMGKHANTNNKDTAMHRHLKEHNSSSLDNHNHHHHASSSTASSKKAPSSSATEPVEYSFHFVRDMSIVGILRGLTVVLGLIALEHVPVSFVETIKATAPAFTVIFAKLILQERTATPVMFTLLPVVAGLILCSASELRFDAIGFVAAVLNNCADCVQNVMSKRLLAHLKPTQLQFYTSVAALGLQAPWLLRDASAWIHNMWDYAASGDGASEDSMDLLVGASGGAGGGDAAIMDTLNDAAGNGGEGAGEWSMGQLLLIDAIFYHLQSVSAYCTMGCMSPVSQSVANTLKRALLVWASILYFGNPVTNTGIFGMMMVVSGVFLYNHMRRLYQS